VLRCCLRSARPGALARYASYHSALGQLRSARAYMAHPDAANSTTRKRAPSPKLTPPIARNQVRGRRDGKGVDDHPSIDSHARWIPGLNKAVELLNQAHDNVQKEEDDSGAKDRPSSTSPRPAKFMTQAIASSNNSGVGRQPTQSPGTPNHRLRDPGVCLEFLCSSCACRRPPGQASSFSLRLLRSFLDFSAAS